MRIEQLPTSVVRIATLGGASTTLLMPALRALQEQLPGISTEVLTMQPDDMQQGLVDGSIDLGLVNVLEEDEQPLALASAELLRGTLVAVVAGSHPLCQRREISLDELRVEPFVGMRTGRQMHRFTRSLFADSLPRTCHLTDGAEAVKLLVAGGVGVSILPSYCVFGDPLERSGLIAARPIAGVQTSVRLVLRYRRRRRAPEAVQVLRDALAGLAHAA